jgi:hypothetical protein
MARKLKERIEHASLTCNKCLKDKPTSEFQKCKGRTTGYQGSCKVCQNKMTAEYRQRTKMAYWKHKKDTPYSIYSITNPEGETYIGYTGTKPSIRWGRHKAQFVHGKCKLVKLHASFVKHGIDNHTFEVIEEVPTRIDAMARETILILKLRAQGKDLNTILSTFRIGQYDKKTGELIKEWETVTEAAKHFGKMRQYFYGAVTKPYRRGTSLGYLWKILPFKDGSYYDFKTNTFTPAIEN